MAASANPVCSLGPAGGGFLARLNSVWHKPAMQLYTVIVLAHWAEHLAQAFQIYALGWPVPEARGVLGLYFPWMVKSEVLHYGYALVMLGAFFALRPGMAGKARFWWTIALAIQFWHHIEHGLLQGQAIAGHNLFGSPVPVSILQLWIPRVELHLFYNTVVTVPMLIAMYYHLFPPEGEVQHCSCGCAVRRKPSQAAA